jgi:hypothetical protein
LRRSRRERRRRSTSRRQAEELLRDVAHVWELEDDPANRRRLLEALFDRVWQDDGTIVAAKLREPFLRDFPTAHDLARRRKNKRGVKGGSDGTRTRDLRRDRPARGNRRRPATTRNTGCSRHFLDSRTSYDRYHR